jgi:hypothetical protein
MRERIQRAWDAIARNPKSTIAGMATIAAAFWPHHTVEISAIAAGLGLICAQDAK